MIFHSPQKRLPSLNIKINKIEIEKVNDFNLLQLVINEHLHWKSHIGKISNSISKTIGVLNKLKHFYH